MGRRRKKKSHKVEPMNYHHRIAKTNGGAGGYGDMMSPNLVRVSRVKHDAYHTLFGTKSPTEVARILTETWIDSAWELKVVARRKE